MYLFSCEAWQVLETFRKTPHALTVYKIKENTADPHIWKPETSGGLAILRHKLITGLIKLSGLVSIKCPLID